MKMKKQRVICLLLVFTMMLGCFGGITLTSTESKAASIYFAGEYKCEKSDYYLDLTIDKYAPGGKISFCVYVVEERIGSGCAGNLTKLSANTYRYKEGHLTLTFKVYDNQIVIKQKGKSFEVGKNVFTGTYNLKKRYAQKAATKNFSVFTKFQRTGKVTKISTNYAYYKTQKSSSPLRYDKTRKIAFTSNTKFYKCKGVTKSGSAFKTQCISKSTAIKEIKNKSRNYVFFKVKNGKATTVLYGMENYFS